MNTSATQAKARRAARSSKRTSRREQADMSAFAARAAARLKEWYGNRVIPDSASLLDELRKDAAG